MGEGFKNNEENKHGHKVLSIPENVYSAIKVPDKQKEKVILKELAVTFYKQGYLSFGKARELANMSKWEFHEELGERRIERHYDSENLEEDLEYGKS
ncbi:UPF0175 family protein [Natranaerofaba carboxydovora]|uniref:UPF0175 family protein n=1 Tax=Natranaerofaba carboxydovora TaxID=2742683 RepID=UPI001F130518|nr:UPF0175 family protein [Natranaerofaba carboxydovora]UMZ72610.1 hypothetical protein ACONDI_00134 [Natranaerofaba carboxydovora]